MVDYLSDKFYLDGKSIIYEQYNGVKQTIGTIDKDTEGRVTAIRFTDEEWADNDSVRSFVSSISGVDRDDVKTYIYAGTNGTVYDTSWVAQKATTDTNGNVTYSPIETSSQMLGTLDEMYAKANEDNQARYDAIIGGLDTLYKNYENYLKVSGQSQKSDINKTYAGLQTQNNQNMVSRGLSGTTIAPTMSAGIESSRLTEQNRLAESLAEQRLNYQMDILGQKYSVMQNKETSFPNYALLSELYKNLGSSS